MAGGGDPGRGPGSLQGRGSECALLNDVIAAVRGGASRTLVVYGEAGIGKTALLQYAVESAADLRILRAAGVESEMELAFASLHQLCGPLLEAVGQLPPPQRGALEVAFGQAAGPAPDRFLVGLAVLTLLSGAAEEGPLLCVVDDAQWLDEVSAKTLAFVARRLLAEPVGLLVAARAPIGELRGLPELEVLGLRTGDARALLGSGVMVRLDERVRDRIVAETHGNPLALLELPRGLSVEQLAGGFGLLDAPRQALPTRLEERFQHRVQAIPAAARDLLLVAAAEPVGDPVLVWRAAQRLGIELGAADATDGLLTIQESVRFRHPLVRSAVYRSATVEQRRRVHLALAEATDRELDPDRRAWHLAAAAPAPDEAVAGELERSAGRAQARGGVAAAAAFLQRAVGLTADPARRTERALAAAELSLQAGELDTAQRLLATAESSPLQGFQAARATLVRGQVAFAAGHLGDAPRLLLNAATQLQPFNLQLAREALLNAWAAAVGAGHLAEGDVLLEICRAVQALTPRAGTPLPLDLLLDGLALLITEGRAAATPTLLRAGRAFAHDDLSVEDTLRWGWLAAAASTAVWDDEGRLAIAARTVQLVRDAGALAQLPVILTVLGTVTLLSGDFAGTAATIAEADSVAAATGSLVAPHIALRLLALQGREAEASALIAATIEQASERSITATNAHWAAALLYNGLGRYQEAVGSAQQATSNTFEPWISIWALPELVEAAARTGDTDLASEALQRLAETTQSAGTDWALGVEARSRALLRDGTAADGLYRQAIDRLGRTRLGPELARAHLLYGEWLRREGRRIDAREQLRTAHHLFATIGMDAFADRTRRELAATGETVRKRSPGARDQLTPQEEQIVRLARDGLSNPEIGAQLFLSSRTVEWHLRKVYTKLGISSRRELWAASVPAAGSSPP